MNRFLSCLFILFALFLAACGSSSVNIGTATTPQPTATQQAQPTDTPTPKPQHFTVGQTVRIGDTWQLVVLTAKNGGTATYLKTGEIFLDFTVKAINISKQEQTMSSLVSWSVRDTDGNTYRAGYNPDAGPALDGKVEAGQPLKGSLVFIAKGEVHHYVLLFQADFTSSGQTIWDINV